ncbi:hypothetical protein [Streptomyces sp. G1]|uniref:hypothetical protein n=1 Tax=Streptomyces sp. G1 TaxID=361572 RepID=UPI00202F5674|nr:hypothetical protein [Streptomyces sp. G1]MCM1964826.1 hypothetical protein [Streptomyces sp. G1]
MAVRGTPTRRVPGNPMAGVLRDLQRSARTMRRTRKPREAEQVDPPIVLTSHPVPKRPAALWAGPAARVAVTNANGMASWAFSPPFDRSPVIGAVPVTRGVLGRGEALTVTIEEVSPEAVTVRVWRITADAALVAPPGVGVHLTAVPAPPGEQG